MKALNRIVTALLAIAVFPVAYFTDLITVYMHATIYDSNIVENLSVKRIVELFTGDGLFAGVFNKDNMSEIPEVLLKFKGNFIAFVVFFAIALLVALAIIIVAAATNSRKTTAALGAAGLLSIGGETPDGRKVRGTLHWVSAADNVKAQVRLYDRLFNTENPAGEDGNGDYLQNINPDSLKIIDGCLLEGGLRDAKPGDTFQFMRQGYFCVDKDSTPGNLIINRTVALNSSWDKKKK